MALIDLAENLYDPGVVSLVAKYFGVAVTFLDSESEKYVIISTPVPEQPGENGSNYSFWQWFFNVTMRNFLTMGNVYSCEFLPPRGEPSAPGGPVEAVVGRTLSVRGGIILELTKAEFDRLMSLGLSHNLKEVKGSPYLYRLHLRGNILSVKLKK